LKLEKFIDNGIDNGHVTHTRKRFGELSAYLTEATTLATGEENGDNGHGISPANGSEKSINPKNLAIAHRLMVRMILSFEQLAFNGSYGIPSPWLSGDCILIMPLAKLKVVSSRIESSASDNSRTMPAFKSSSSR
jgi:hypothetical protein